MAIRQLTADEDYDGDIIFQQFSMACDANPILGFTKYFGFMPLLDISKIYIESNLYESLISSLDESIDGLLEEYSEAMMEIIEEQLDEGGIEHINTKFDFWFNTRIPGVDAVTFMPQKKSADQGACLYFGPAVSSELLKQLVDGMSDDIGMTCDSSDDYIGD